MRRTMFGRRGASLVVCAFATALCLPAVQAQAGEFAPTKPIQMIAAAAPGGGSDVMARTIAQIVASETLAPQPMVVQNIPGGGSAIGTTQVARMKGDTHALLVFNPASVAGVLVAGKGAATVRDLTMIAQLALDEQLIVVKSDSRFKSIKDIVAEAKTKENALSIAGADGLGFWVDLKTAYVTYTKEYIESVWWILGQLWDKGLLYQGFKVVPYCPRCGTPLSDHEVALGYAEAVDPSVFVRMPLVDEPGTSLLVWTTTPWALPGNVAVAAHPDVDYVTVEHLLPEGGRERLILAQPLLEKVFGDEYYRVVDTYKGRKLKGMRYKPLFTFLPVDKPAYFVVPGR